MLLLDPHQHLVFCLVHTKAYTPKVFSAAHLAQQYSVEVKTVGGRAAGGIGMEAYHPRSVSGRGPPRVSPYYGVMR